MTNDYANMIMISWVMEKGGFGDTTKKAIMSIDVKFICHFVSRFDFKDIFFIYCYTMNNFVAVLDI